MKRVKIMLTAVTVLAIVGGALAFKAKTTGFHLYQCDLNQNKCLVVDALNSYILDDIGTIIPNATITSTDPGSLPCQIGCPNTIKVSVELAN